ncbi:MAG: VOC family protein [Dehalococcoidia bacterium]|nr:VOC family protein [Dehalococcoidia bacterium]
MEPNPGPIALPSQLHIGAVVRDLDKTINYLSSTFGIGPWDIRERRYPKEQVVVGKGPFAYRVAFAAMGPIELELIEVVEGSTIHAEFLANKGEGLHHIGFRVPDLQQVEASLQRHGVGVTQSAFREGARYAYMDPSELGGITFEFTERTAG